MSWRGLATGGDQHGESVCFSAIDLCHHRFIFMPSGPGLAWRPVRLTHIGVTNRLSLNCRF